MRQNEFVLNEWPFGSRLLVRAVYDPEAWRACVAAREKGLGALRKIGFSMIVSGPNQGSICRQETRMLPLHTKKNLLRLPGYW